MTATNQSKSPDQTPEQLTEDFSWETLPEVAKDRWEEMVAYSSTVENQLSKAKASRSQAETERQRIATETLDATKDACRAVVADSKRAIAKLKGQAAATEQNFAESRRQLEQAEAIRQEADAYRESTLASVEKQAQEILLKATHAAKVECARLRKQASLESYKLLAQAEGMRAAAQEELEAQKIYAEAAMLKADAYDGIVQVVRALSDLDGTRPEEWALRHGLELYFGSSVKGEAEIDWDNQKERQALLQKIVADADLVLELARQVQGQFPEESPQRQGIVEAAELLGQLLLQDVERQEDGPALKDGVSRDRIPSVHDPEMRHGRKSSSKRFDGHKAAVVVDTDSQLVTAVDILPGNAGDNTGVLELVEQSEENTGIAVEETIGDAAYGDGGTRQAFADAGRTLIAKVPGRPNKACFPKEDFQIDLEAGTCTCPAGNVTHTLRTFGTRTNRLGRTYLARSFQFDPAVCGVCPLRSQCVAARYGAGRTVALHPQEALLQQARDFQRSEGFAEYRRLRQAAEHRLARLAQLGVRQSRYFGRAKTRFQLLMAATVANLTLVATKMGMISPAPGSSHDKPDQQAPGSPIVTTQFILAAANWVTLSLRLTVHWLSSTPSRHSRAFQPGF